MLLVPTPDVKRDIILVGSCIRKSPDIVAAYLRCLAWQRPIPGVEVAYHFILDTADEAVHHLVNEFLATRDGMAEIEDSPAPAYDDNHAITHQWTSEAMGRVGWMKDRIIQRALQMSASHLWFCDADLLCDPNTLRSLWYAGQPVACAVYWTRWNNHPSIHAAPQVWLRHPYDLTGRGYPDEATFRARLQTKELTQVWGQGACTLIQRSVLESGVRFAYLPGVSQDGMMAGEDRHFSIACEQRHIPMYADPWPHIFHVYHPEDRGLIDQYEKAFAAMCVVKPPRWVSLRCAMLEPIPTGPGTFGHLHPVHIRCRVDTGAMLPDLERQILDHLDGQPFIADVHYPSTYPIDWLRGTRRLMEVTVVDSKDSDHPPVLHNDMAGPIDLSRYTAPQQETLHG